MRFFKDNLDSIVKLYINQIGVAIFAFFLYTAAGAISENGTTTLLMKVLISVFAVLFYFVLIYNVAWEIGAKDKIRIDGGRMERKDSKGIYLGLWANVPNFVVIGIAFLLFALYMAFDAEGLKTFFAILNLIFRFFVSMYLGLIQGITSSFADDVDLTYLVQTLLFLVFSLVSALITHVSYILGLKDFRFFPPSKQQK